MREERVYYIFILFFFDLGKAKNETIEDNAINKVYIHYIYGVDSFFFLVPYMKKKHILQLIKK